MLPRIVLLVDTKAKKKTASTKNRFFSQRLTNPKPRRSLNVILAFGLDFQPKIWAISRKDLFFGKVLCLHIKATRYFRFFLRVTHTHDVHTQTYRRTKMSLVSEELNEKGSSKDSVTKDVQDDVEGADPTVVDESTHDPHMHRSLKRRHVSMIAIVSFTLEGFFFVAD